MNTGLHYSSAKSDWETPPDLFATIDDEFAFTLDAAASPHNAKVDRFYTEDDDGLAQTWDGTIWVNPPYGRGIGKWATKAITESARGATVVMLVPARTDSIWFQQLAHHAQEIRLLAGRVTFVGATEPAPFPCALVILRPGAVWTQGSSTTFTMPTRHDPSHPWTRMLRIG